MNRVKTLLSKYKENGLLHILAITIFNKMLSFLGGLAIVRILSKSDYGNYSYAYNLVGIALLVSGLGIEYGIQQYCSEARPKSEKASYFRFGCLFGLIFNSAIIIIMFWALQYTTLSIEAAKPILFMLLPMIITQFAINYASISLRVTFRNKKYAFFLGLNSFSTVLFSIIGAYLWDLKGYILGLYASVGITLLYLLIVEKPAITAVFNAAPLKNKTELIKYSVSCAINHGLTNVLYTADIFILGLILANSEIISSYKVGIALPMALYAIPVSFMTIAFPYFAKNRENKEYVLKLSKITIVILFAISGAIGLFMFVFNNEVVSRLYGVQYSDAKDILRVCSCTFVIAASLKIPLSNILSSQRWIKFNLINSVISSIANIILDVLFILWFGAIGAAYATLVVTIISSVVSVFFFYYNTKIKLSN